MMTSDEFREAIDKLSLSQSDVARLLNIDGRTVRRYAGGDAPVIGPVELMLRLLLERPTLLRAVQRIGQAAGFEKLTGRRRIIRDSTD
jgi:DNA-binding transcriptional regulator YiaG